ncbi:MAG: amidohydrolase family protein [Myxococcales bacterium]|nr:amidohydrolase family protein [Myxococcales bacterium]
MSYDIKIKGGTIIDGTGRERYSGDVGITDGRIVAVGKVDGDAKREIDADGALVTPGFTDIHTHYDGQVSWDDELSPSCLHGVTTAVMGSCGVGFAPVRKTDHDRLIQLMEGVEDIPGSALAEGLTWNWESFPEYMDAIDAFPHAIDFAVQVPHDALRVYVMGDRAVADAPATPDDISAMQRLTRAALEAGAVGFSTGRTDNHRQSDGTATPASEAHQNELCGIAQAFHGLSHGVLQAVSDFDMAIAPSRFDDEFDAIEKMVEAAADHPCSISLMQRDHSPNQWKQILARCEQATARGVTMRVQVAPRPIGIMLGLQATFHPFMGFPTYKTFADLPLSERVEKLRDPQVRARILSEKSDKVSGDGSSIPPLADHFLANLDMVAMRLYRLGERPNYEPSFDSCFANEARIAQKTVLETIYDALLEQNGRALLYFPLYNYTELNLENVRTMMSHPLALPGLSDGGAHVGTVCDASFPTHMLSYWGRDRHSGRFPLERLVKMQAYDTSRYIGFNDRGAIEVGQKADVNIIDFDNLQLLHPRIQHDLPAGGRRLMQGATGYLATIKSGDIIAERGELTESRPGRLVRLGQ